MKNPSTQQLINSILSGQSKQIAEHAQQWVQSLRTQVITEHAQTLTEIRWRSAEVVDSALDAPIQCGFEAEVSWPGIDYRDEEDIDFLDDIIGDYDYEEAVESNIISDQVQTRIKSDYLEDLKKSFIYDRAWGEVFDDYETEWIKVNGIDYVAEFMDELSDDVVAELRQEAEGHHANMIAAQQRRVENYKQNPEQGSAEVAQRRLNVLESWSDIQRIWKYLYLYSEANSPSGLRHLWPDFLSHVQEYSAEALKNDPYIEEEAIDLAKRDYNIDGWISDNWGSFRIFLEDYDVDYREFAQELLDARGGNERAGGLYEVGDVVEQWAELNSKYKQVRVSLDYQGGKPRSGERQDYWRVEPDSTIESPGTPAEIVSPVYDSPREMIEEMQQLFEWIQGEGAETDQSTGLHVTMSMSDPKYRSQGINGVKMAVMLGDTHLLKQFDRLGNSFTKSQLERLRVAARGLTQTSNFESLEQIQQMLKDRGGISMDKMYSINIKDTENTEGNRLIEFRIAGGGDYFDQEEQVQDAVVRYATVMQMGYDPDAYRREYATKLFRLIDRATSIDDDHDGKLTQEMAGMRALAQAVKLLGFTDSTVMSDVLSELRDIKGNIQKDLLDPLPRQVSYVIGRMAQQLQAGKVENKPSAKMARLLRLALSKLGGLDLVTVSNIAMDMYGGKLGPFVARSISELFAAPQLLDKLGIQPAEHLVQLNMTNDTLMIDGALASLLHTRNRAMQDDISEYRDQINALVHIKIFPKNIIQELKEAGTYQPNLGDNEQDWKVLAWDRVKQKLAELSAQAGGEIHIKGFDETATALYPKHDWFGPSTDTQFSAQKWYLVPVHEYYFRDILAYLRQLGIEITGD